MKLMKVMKLKIFNEEKSKTKSLVDRRIGAALTFVVVVVLLLHDISKRKKVTSTECLHRDVRLEVLVEVKPVSYDVT